MFQVFDSDLPANSEAYPSLTKTEYPEHWINDTFETYGEAYQYALDWLGGNQAIKLEVNVPYVYDGFDDFIVIKQIG